MRETSQLTLSRLDWPLKLFSALVLLVLLFYGYANIFHIPIAGIELDGDWFVRSIEDCETRPGWCQEFSPTILEGDQVLAIGALTYADFLGRANTIPFDGYQPGDQVVIRLSRDGSESSVSWQMPPITFLDRVGGAFVYIVILPFWLVGTLVLLYLKPRNTRWRLLYLANYSTAIWLATGFNSFSQIAYSSQIFGAITWLMSLIYFHLHLHVPEQLLKRSSRIFLPGLYLLAGLMVVLEFLQSIPAAAYNLALLLAMGGGIGVMVYRLLSNPTSHTRIVTRLMLVGSGLAFGPGIVLWVIPSLVSAPIPESWLVPFILMAVPIFPFVYAYAIYKRQLGDLEFRANRFLSRYSYTLINTSIFGLVFILVRQWTSSPDGVMSIGLLIGVIFLFISPFTQSRYQQWVDHLVYGKKHDPQDILKRFASRIPTASDRHTLIELLVNEILPILMIRQSVLYQISDDEARIVFEHGIELEKNFQDFDKLKPLILDSDKYRAPDISSQSKFNWARLVLALEIRGRLIGVWLFGKRDPDDFYAHHDISLLRALANQVAVAVENSRLYTAIQQELWDRQQVEETLQESNRRLEGVLNELETVQEKAIAQERLAAVGQLAAGIAHDFNNALMPITLYSEMLLKEPELIPQAHERLEIILGQANHAATLTQQILDFSRKSLIKLQPMDLLQFLDEFGQLLKRTLPENIEVELTCGPEAYFIHGDPARMQQVFLNLALNARDAMPDGGKFFVELAILQIDSNQATPSKNKPPDKWVQVKVIDTGVGIAPEHLSHIFEPFYTTKQVGEGSGLGLAQVYGSVKQHGGHIEVVSEVDRGTTFVIYLPAKTEEESVESIAGDTVEGARENILVVEDDEAAQQAIVDILEMLNYRVLTADNALDALDLFKRNQIDLVLSDMVMPEMGGGAFYETLQKIDSDVRMVVLSGYPLGENGRALLEKGVVAWVQKPVNIEVISNTVRQALES